MKSKNEIIVLGGGCFWCTEAVFSMLNGVIIVTPGYSGGVTKNPSYKEVSSGETGHAEVIKVEFDPSKIKLSKLLKVFFTSHDPTTPNKQGNDMGPQYRSIILYSNEKQKEEIEKYIQKIKKNFTNPMVTQIQKLEEFFSAEAYHKDYFKNNKLNPYCILVINPKLKKLKKEYSDLLEKSKLKQ
ncbi:peptide-methionine (S)-S-oxide reductase MsrA [Candidatus Woesearchaeota archaeon]|nr:peptide-methionine (S)-S-oxide reductase MsrA [Candidatus Woesearchaeota archaeon]